ncbi:DNA mismatch repair endonuclease MutL [Legionella fairfieldensis]|uniref:DNA mismatch repair endonuclease MutL n=1 Tax=Legionella fairfieldensis TaxID=45064 RepID=UPI00048BDF48|nr:DNA mismatch repair endonuclease MutL [Legionella fairfieldensis]
MRIQQLPSIIANQIAAGEVIENPASVVKELLENSLDAQANVISIEIGYGGLNQIRISDNGVGILAEDLPLAIAAHATSKISELKDLYTISSMGFRGEALASIASVSRLTISSKPAAQEHGMQLSTEGGGTIMLSPCARNQGTTIDVRDIFFNAPVRKKFLKSERSEFLALEKVVKRFALSAPHIAINLSHNGRQIFNLPAANCDKSRLSRIRKVLGKTFIDKAAYVEVEHETLRLHGWVCTQDYQRSQNDKLWIYVNTRIVKDKLLNHAVMQAYESILHPGRYPSCLLYLTIDPAEVDVNVHPTKHEIRFQQPRLIHDFISSHIKQTLCLPAAISSVVESYQPNETEDELQVCEPLSSFSPMIREAQASRWLILNGNFVLLFLHEKPYLADLVAIQRHWLVSTLMKQTLPLAGRPLLVPVSHSLTKISIEEADTAKDTLFQIGIELDFGGENTFIVRSLPVAVPHLDLKRFLIAFFENTGVSSAQLIDLLAQCQYFNAQQATQEDLDILINYIQTSPADDKLTFFYKYLSDTTCRELLDA